MKLYGVTGGIGSGKSAAMEAWRKLGWPAVDTDKIARDLVEPGREAVAEIRCEFGSAIVSDTGVLNRRALARVVFEDQGARARLERILHPKIRAQWRLVVEEWRLAGWESAAVIIPLLFETHAEGEFDRVICVACSPKLQRERLLTRGWDQDEIDRRIRSQWPVSEKMDFADYVVWNESTLEVLDEQIEWISRH